MKEGCRMILKRIILVLISITIIICTVTSYAETDPAEIQEEIIKTQSGESYTSIVEIGGKTYLIYAQNSPDWGNITAGKKADTKIKDALCAVFSLSNIIVNCVNEEDLDKIRSLTIKDIKFDTKTVAAHKGYKDKYKFVIQTNEDYIRYFPLCIANLASGNARISVGQIRSRGYYKKLFKTYDIEYKEVKSLKECIEYVEQGTMASVCTGGKLSPIAPKFGHYFVMAYADKSYVYFIDSLFRDHYEHDKNNIIEVIEPGVFRVKRENVKELAISGSKFVVWPKDNKTKYTKEKYEQVVKLSNKQIQKR